MDTDAAVSISTLLSYKSKHTKYMVWLILCLRLHYQSFKDGKVNIRLANSGAWTVELNNLVEVCYQRHKQLKAWSVAIMGLEADHDIVIMELERPGIEGPYQAVNGIKASKQPIRAFAVVVPERRPSVSRTHEVYSVRVNHASEHRKGIHGRESCVRPWLPEERGYGHHADTIEDVFLWLACS